MFASRTEWSLTRNRLSNEIAERRRLGLPLIDLTESNPTRCGFVYDEQGILAALSDPRALTYEPDPRGLLPAREAVAAYYAERGVEVSPEQIFLTTSTSEAYSYVFRLLANPGDQILVPHPSYPLFDFLAGLNDVELQTYELGYRAGWSLNTEALGATVSHEPSGYGRRRAILVVHPNNPTGSFIHEGELAGLIGACQEHNLAFVADEVFLDYAFAPDSANAASRRAGSHAAIRGVLAFTLSGLSKIAALPQMKLGWIVVSGPDDLRQAALARLEVIADTYLSVSAPLAHALPQLLATRQVIQPQILRRLRRNLDWLDHELASHPALERLESEGGWYTVLQIQGPSDRAAESPSEEDWTVEFVRQDGVLVHPGHFYDFPSEGHLVVSLLPPPEIFEAGMRKVITRLAEQG